MPIVRGTGFSIGMIAAFTGLPLLVSAGLSLPWGGNSCLFFCAGCSLDPQGPGEVCRGAGEGLGATALDWREGCGEAEPGALPLRSGGSQGGRGGQPGW